MPFLRKKHRKEKIGRLIAARYCKDSFMSEKNDKKNTKAADTDKIDINKSVFQVKKDIRKQRDEETARQQLEMAQKIADREKEKREAYERKIQEEKIELMRMKQGVLDESEATIHEEKEEEIKLTFWQKIGNFFYHNKWWLGLGAFFTALAIFLIADLMSAPRPDMTILMLCDNSAVGTSAYLEDYFSGFAEDFNGNGKVLVSVYYIPYSDDEVRNYTSGVSGKLSTYLSGTDSVMIIGNKKTVTDILVPEETLTDLSKLYPDDPHVKDYFYYIKDTDFAEQIGVPSGSITGDMFFALRTPIDPINGVNEKLQKTYDKDFPVFDRIIKSLSESN